MKELFVKLLDELKFTKKSLFFIALIVSAIIAGICAGIGFKDQYDLILSLSLIGPVFFAYITYFIYVFCLYYMFPKNKEQKMEVLFFLNTHGNEQDYKAIKEKFCENFEELADSIKNNILNPIILTQKQSSAIKKINNKEVQLSLLEKTNCLFAIIIKATDIGRKSDEYELQIAATIKHPHLPVELQNALSNNLDYIFHGLHVKTLRKENDLDDLCLLSTQLFYVCQFIFALASEYYGDFQFALKIFNELIDISTQQNHNSKNPFYNQFEIIGYYEICNCAIGILSYQYNQYIRNKTYDSVIAYEILKKFNGTLCKINNDNYIIQYHLAKSVYYVMVNKIAEAKGETIILKKKFPKTNHNSKPWAFSETFLIACENKKKNYSTIIKKYNALKNNDTQDSLTIFQFIDRYQKENSKNLGIKIALLSLIFYRSDLSYNLISVELKNEVIEELLNLECNDVAEAIRLFN